MPRLSVELGWMNLPPCTKVDWVKTSIPGISQPVIRTAEQRLTAFADIETTDIADAVKQVIKDCALASVAAAGGIGAITANPAAAVEGFKTAFLGCFTAKLPGVAIGSVDIHTNTSCSW